MNSLFWIFLLSRTGRGQRPVSLEHSSAFNSWLPRSFLRPFSSQPAEWGRESGRAHLEGLWLSLERGIHHFLICLQLVTGEAEWSRSAVYLGRRDGYDDHGASSLTPFLVSLALFTLNLCCVFKVNIWHPLPFHRGRIALHCQQCWLCGLKKILKIELLLWWL